MWVESVAGEGSTFHFTITAEAAEVPSRAAAAGVPSELPASACWWSTTTPSTGASSTCRPRPGASTATRSDVGRRGAGAGRARRPVRPRDPRHAHARHGRRRRWRVGCARSAARAAAGAATRRSAADEIDPVFAAVLAKPVKQSQLFDLLVSLLGAAAPPSARPAERGRGHPARRAPSAAHPARRGQHREPAARPAAARVDGVPRRRRRQRRRGGRGGGPPALRPGADGRADAGDGRSGGHASHPRRRAEPRSRASSP